MQALQEQLNQASQALRSGQAKQAKQLFQTALQHPQAQANAGVWLGLAFACGNAKDSQGALDAVNRALQLQPQNPQALLFKADNLWHGGEKTTAAEFYQGFLIQAEQNPQLAPDLRAQVPRAQANYQSVENEQLGYLQEQVNALGLKPENTGPRFQEALDISMGKKQFYPQQPSKFFFPQLPHIQFFDTENFEWVEQLESATATIKQELEAVLAKGVSFEPYLQSSEEVPTLSQSSNWDNDDWGAFYLWKSGDLQESAKGHFPNTLKALDTVPFATVPGSSPNVLFSRLRPKTRIDPHHGFLNTRLICHLPLIIPENCGALRCGNESRQWQEGKLMIFDDSIEHEAWNDSDSERVVLIFEIWRPELSEAERDAVAKLLHSIKSYQA
ncbi:aspartyl/asparaginyl beta-hydroxylase domain-containing protein [Pseudoteredinibacter isoporae]|uniref:Aspartyl/asparaginyl beta-hydroxylase (Cupin superfamily) n=1 Tax=Pseudoteredinibacter isoporae TaxID=570281 RepID=A0A7X0JR77_9GAMM|nr:aspartyl/asparaginyl beta-hydroxylase domain-containing protein [Pseudoteredinibacter isoporae]MBB6520657.1 aspartyl/asparaginyl beta-hydroxylase (cupin superfamily) [Pseudoteredinibacter isoporae]NHO86224.1 tetratricopeptide repeat protein [Pseudoteredinibacter isoporae]NIB25325.1 tetratricopeptide repeat protein [Pseudoteredinibacter isoporae]